MPARSITVLVIGIVILLPVPSLYAQGPDSLWHRAYGDTLSDFAFAVEEAFDGCYVTVGQMQIQEPGSTTISSDIVLVKTESDGDMVWMKTYGGPGEDGSRDVLQTADGGFLITGYTDSFSPGHYDLYLIKTDANGDTVWTRTYGDTRHDEVGFSVRAAVDSGYFVAGDIETLGSGTSSVYLLRVSDSGDYMWSRTYSKGMASSARELDIVRDGGCIIVGSTFDPYADIYLIRTDANGDTLWTRTYGGSDGDYGTSVISQLGGSHFMVAGYSESAIVHGYDAFLMKVDSNGDLDWNEKYGGDGNEDASSVRETSDGGYVLTGSTDSYGAGINDFYLIRTNSNGDTLWTATYGGSGNDWGKEGLQTIDGSYVMAGVGGSFGPPFLNLYLVKAGADPAGVPGGGRRVETALDLTVMPSPSRGGVSIEYMLLVAGEVRVAVYDFLGREVATLKGCPESAGFHEAAWDGLDSRGERVSPGLYFVRFTAGDEVAARKVVMMR